MKKLISIFILLITFSSFAQFKLPKKADWEIANSKPIIILQLDEDDENAAVFNPNIKKYSEEIFGAERVEKYLTTKEFYKFIKGNKGKYNFIGFKANKSSNDGWFTSLYFGICGKAFMINNGFLLMQNYNVDNKKSTFLKTEFKQLSEADIKFALKAFKSQIEYGIQNPDMYSMKEMIANGKKSPKELNPRAEELKNLTLLIDKNLVGKNFENEFTNKYKYSFEFVERTRIDQAILDDENVAFISEYVTLSSNGSFVSLLYIYNAKDCLNIYTYIPEKTGYFLIDSVKALTTDFSINYLKKLNSAIE
jgi:hypothetical protein